MKHFFHQDRQIRRPHLKTKPRPGKHIPGHAALRSRAQAQSPQFPREGLLRSRKVPMDRPHCRVNAEQSGPQPDKRGENGNPSRDSHIPEPQAKPAHVRGSHSHDRGVEVDKPEGRLHRSRRPCVLHRHTHTCIHDDHTCRGPRHTLSALTVVRESTSTGAVYTGLAAEGSEPSSV